VERSSASSIRQAGISEQIVYRWKKHSVSLGVNQIRRLRMAILVSMIGGTPGPQKLRPGSSAKRGRLVDLAMLFAIAPPDLTIARSDIKQKALIVQKLLGCN